MFSRLTIAVAAVACLALGAVVSVSAASTSNEVPIGRAQLYSGGALVGDAFIRRQLTLGQTHVMLRLTGLVRGSQPVWKIEAGAFCGFKPTSILLTAGGTQAATAIGGLMVSESHAVVLPVQAGSTSQMTLRVYSSGRLGLPPTEIACGQIYSQPSLGSQHWW